VKAIEVSVACIDASAAARYAVGMPWTMLTNTSAEPLR
jgi:hypothetical protein